MPAFLRLGKKEKRGLGGPHCQQKAGHHADHSAAPPEGTSSPFHSPSSPRSQTPFWNAIVCATPLLLRLFPRHSLAALRRESASHRLGSNRSHHRPSNEH